MLPLSAGHGVHNRQSEAARGKNLTETDPATCVFETQSADFAGETEIGYGGLSYFEKLVPYPREFNEDVRAGYERKRQEYRQLLKTV